MVVGSLALASATVHRPATAEPAEANATRRRARAVLRWDAPPACPDGARMKADIERLLGDDVDFVDRMEPESPAAFVLDARVRQVEGRYHLEADLVGADGTRSRHEADAAHCATLSGVAALYFAIFLDPNAARAWKPSTPAARPNAPPVPPTRTRAPRAVVSARAFAGVQAGFFRGASADTGVSVIVELPHLWIEVGGLFGFRRTLHGVRPEGEVQSRIAGGLIRVCGVLHHRKLDFPLCWSTQVGALLSQGSGFESARSVASPWWITGLSPGMVWNPIPRVGLWGAIEADVAVLRPGYAVAGLGEVARVGWGGGSAWLGLQVRFR